VTSPGGVGRRVTEIAPEKLSETPSLDPQPLHLLVEALIAK
jgi:hypothetical protein